ncbi:hypothetical protein KIL84_006235 [Mauremys mutica]|uniref:Uncharacterized protein n=1 Tax=Mauremys mutica TaxID=74926 RepID=A0A9D3WYX6_9SAUR|nr:hypothetical protein KIL84_006235 [Mauremys mutica]
MARVKIGLRINLTGNPLFSCCVLCTAPRKNAISQAQTNGTNKLCCYVYKTQALSKMLEDNFINLLLLTGLLLHVASEEHLLLDLQVQCETEYPATRRMEINIVLV